MAMIKRYRPNIIEANPIPILIERFLCIDMSYNSNRLKFQIAKIMKIPLIQVRFLVKPRIE